MAGKMEMQLAQGVDRGDALKKKTSRSKSGCLTCKIRRVKCDETRPNCKRCSATGRRCDGYPQPNLADKWVVNTITKPPISLSLSRPTSMPGSDRRGALDIDFFRHHVALNMSRYAKSTLWNQLILQAIHEEPAAHYAATAFSALYRAKRACETVEYSKMSLGKCEAAYPFRQYGKAIVALQDLLHRGDTRSVEVALMCSLLCICFEVLEGDHPLALQHLDHSLKVIQSKQIDDTLARTFADFDLHASSYVGRRPPVLQLQNHLNDLPRFCHFYQAEISLQCVLNSFYTFRRTIADDFRYREPGAIPLHVLAEADHLQSQLERWRVMFACLLDQCEGKTEDGEAERTKLLRIAHESAIIMNATCLYAEETIYDSFEVNFRTIVSLAAEVLSSAGGIDASKNEFSLDMAVVQPLFLTATKCRSVPIRQQAINLLYMVPGPEGVWDGLIMVKIAERVKQIEEESLHELLNDDFRVPEFRRVHSVDTDIDPKARRSPVFYRRRLNGMDGEWNDVEELISW